MRIAVSLDLNPVPLYRKEDVFKGYLKEKLEVEYTRAIKYGFGRKIYGLYVSANKAIESGKKDLALKLLDMMRESVKKFEQTEFYFGGKYECPNCVLISIAEDLETFFRIKYLQRKHGVRRIYFNYDKNCHFVPKGAILDIDAIKEIYKTRFVAVA